MIEKAIHVVKPGGHIFIGDQRSLPLLETFALSVETFGVSSGMIAGELRDRIRTRIQQEQQLVLSPTFFLSVGRRHPKVSSVEIYPRRGIRENEMTRFRYDAILRIGPQSPEAVVIPFLDPPEGGWKLDEDAIAIEEEPGQAQLDSTRIVNSRLVRDAHLLARLAIADAQQPLAKLYTDPHVLETQAIHPEAIAQLAAETGHEVAISWASCYSEGNYDAAFIPQRSSGPGHDTFRQSAGRSQPQPITSSVVMRPDKLNSVKSSWANWFRTAVLNCLANLFQQTYTLWIHCQLEAMASLIAKRSCPGRAIWVSANYFCTVPCSSIFRSAPRSTLPLLLRGNSGTR